MRVFAIIIITLFVSCSSDSDCVNSFGTPFEVREGRTFCLPDNSSIVVDEISESYCPCMVDCLWEGEAVIVFRRITEEGEETTVTINEIMNQDNPDWAGITEVLVTETCDPDIASISMVINR